MHDFQVVSLLAGLSLAYAVLSGRVTRVRLAVTSGRVPSLLALWAMCGVVLLGWPGLAFLIGVLALIDWFPRRAVYSQRLGHYLYSWSVAAGLIVTAKFAIAASLQWWVILPTAAGFAALDFLLVAGVMWIRDAGNRDRVREMAADWQQHCLVATAAAAGLGVGVGIQRLGVSALVGLPVALLGLHVRAIRSIECRPDVFDLKTMTWNHGGFIEHAKQLAASVTGFVAVIAIEVPVDHRADIVPLINSLLDRRVLAGRIDNSQCIALALVAGPAAGGTLLLKNIRRMLAQSAIPATIGMGASDAGDLAAMVTVALLDLDYNRGRMPAAR